MRTVRPRFEVKRRPTRSGKFKYTVVDTQLKKVRGTNGWPEWCLPAIIQFAAELNSLFREEPIPGAGTTAEENFEES